MHYHLLWISTKKYSVSKGGVRNTLPLANPSGWMCGEIFIDVMKHFIHYSYSSKDKPSLLLMDNHESHLELKALDLAKENGVTLPAFPHGFLVQTWHGNHSGHKFFIYDIAPYVRVVYHKAMTPWNIMSAFANTSIILFNKQIFDNDDFLPSSVTD